MQTKFSREEKILLKKATTQIFSLPDALIFRFPVEWKKMNLFDYPEVIKNPCDLTTIRVAI